ncbi:MAG: hypothetical protein Q4E22_04705 [Coriobacteriia bacterium]|nr:hypothetical protein [Coriobacteriia bacterium]
MGLKDQDIFGTNLSQEVLIVEKEALPLASRGCLRFGWISGQSAIVLALFLLPFFIATLLSDFENPENLYLTYALALAIGLSIAFFVWRKLTQYLYAPFGIALIGKKVPANLGSILLLSFLNIVVLFRYGQAYPAYLPGLITVMLISFELIYAYYMNGDVVLSSLVGLVILLSLSLINFGELNTQNHLLLVLLVSMLISLIYGVARLVSIIRRSMHASSDDLVHSRYFVSDKDDERLLLVAFLGNYLEPRFILQLINLTFDENPHVSKGAKKALARVWGPEKNDFQHSLERISMRMQKDTQEEKASDIADEIYQLKLQATRELNKHKQSAISTAQDLIEHHPSELKRLYLLLDEAYNDLEPVDAERFVVSIAQLLVFSQTHEAYAHIIKQIRHSSSQTAYELIDILHETKDYKAIIHLIPFVNSEKTWLAAYALDTIQEYISGI